MDTMQIAWIDLFAWFWFLGCWFTYAQLGKQNCGLTQRVNEWRNAWAKAMLYRDNRMVDIQAINAFIHNVTFLASTTIFILAGLFAMLGYVEQGTQLFNALPFVPAVSPLMWELKTLTLVLIFIYAFFKFSWSISQHSMSAVVLASVPDHLQADTEEAQLMAKRMACLSSLGAKHFNDGVQAYYFALAGVGWYLHAWVFILATLWVILVLYRREYRSQAYGLLSADFK